MTEPGPLDPSRDALRASLLALVPADAEEARDRDAIVALVESSADCFSRRHYEPGHVTGSVFILCRATGKVLLHHHRRLDRWLQMGGHDEGDRDAAVTALREGQEESGLSDLALLSPSILDVHVHDIPAAKGEPHHLHHDVRYAAVTERPDEIRRDDAESLALAWFDLEEAARLMGEPGSTRMLRKLAARL